MFSPNPPGKLVVLVLSVAAIVIGYFAFQNHANFEKALVAKNQEALLAGAQATSRGLEHFILNFHRELATAVKIPEIQNTAASNTHETPEHEATPHLFKTIFENFDIRIDSFYLLNADGEILDRYPFKPIKIGISYLDRPGVPEVIKHHSTHVSGMFKTRTGDKAFSIIYPIFKDKVFAGMLRAVIRMETLYKHFLQTVHVGDAGQVFLIDSQGVIYCHQNQEVIGFKIHELFKKDHDDTCPLLDQILSSGEDCQTIDLSMEPETDSRWAIAWSHVITQPGTTTTARILMKCDPTRPEISRNQRAKVIASSLDHAISKIQHVVRPDALNAILDKLRNRYQDIAQIVVSDADAFQNLSPAHQSNPGITKPTEPWSSAPFETLQYIEPTIREFTEHSIPMLEVLAPIRTDEKSLIIVFALPYTQITGALKNHALTAAGIFALILLLLAFSGTAFYKYQNNKNRLETETKYLSEIVKSQLALDESNQKYRAMMEAMKELVCISSQEFVIEYLNPAMIQKLGKDATGQLCYEAIFGRSEKCPWCPQKTERKSQHIETEFCNPKDQRYYITSHAPIYHADGSTSEMTIYKDLTDLKKTQEEKKDLERRLMQAQKMESLGLLAGGVAHDLNNVLSASVSYPDLILVDLPQDSSIRNAILTIKESGEKAAAIVQDLLTLARRGVTKTEALSLNHLINDYVRSPEYKKLLADYPDIHIRTNLQVDLSNVSGSPFQIRKILMNLASNAAEALPFGGLVDISTKNLEVQHPIKSFEQIQEGEYVVLQVRDNGIGISQRDLNRIFEPFYTKKVMGRSGTGLGMAVVWGIVKDHKGFIDITSREGNGTCISIYLPATQEQTAATANSLPVEDYMGSGEMILVVDDMPEQRELALKILTRLGYQVATVESGEAAIVYLKEHSADLLILDMLLGDGMDGLDTYREILKIHHAQKAIISSGFSETDRIRETIRLGAGLYLKKPYSMEKIGIAVKSELLRKPTIQES